MEDVLRVTPRAKGVDKGKESFDTVLVHKDMRAGPLGLEGT